MVRTVSPVLRLSRRRTIVRKSRTINLRETDLRPDTVRATTAGLRGAYERAADTRLVERPPITETLERRRCCWR